MSGIAILEPVTLLLSFVKHELDKETFATLFEHARPSLRVVAGAECGFAHADDAVQQGAITAMRKLSSFTPGTDFDAWAAAIVRGAARNTRKAEHRHRERSRRGAVRYSPGITDAAVLDERLTEALETLTSEQRCCLLLKTTQNKSYKQIGDMLGIPEPTARSHAYRARAALLAFMSDQKERSA